MTDQTSGDLELVEISTHDNGREVVWCESAGEAMRLLSVPVFAYGVSRDAMLRVELDGHRLRFKEVIRKSPGATIRCYVAEPLRASDVYRTRVISDAQAYGLRISPATFFDPEIVAIHVAERKRLEGVAKYFDQLVREGVLRFWEMGDPAAASPEDPVDVFQAEPWELVHPLPVNGQPSVAEMH